MSTVTYFLLYSGWEKLLSSSGFCRGVLVHWLWGASELCIIALSLSLFRCDWFVWEVCVGSSGLYFWGLWFGVAFNICGARLVAGRVQGNPYSHRRISRVWLHVVVVLVLSSRLLRSTEDTSVDAIEAGLWTTYVIMYLPFL